MTSGILVDACVIGGGPAALSSVLTLRRRGLSVALVRPIAKARQFGRSECHLETLSADALEALTQVGATAGFAKIGARPVTARVSRWGGSQAVETASIKKPGGIGWLIDKPAFVRMLDNLVDDGVTQMRGRVSLARRSSSGVLLRINNGGTGLVVSAAYAVDASGRSRAIARALGASVTCTDTLVSAWVSWPAGNPSDQSVRLAAVNDGWAWSAVDSAGMRHVGYFTDGDLLARKRAGISDLVLRLAADGFVFDEADRPSAEMMGDEWSVRAAASTALDRAFGEQWVACGDAAQSVDPLSSSGSTTALWQGIAAGRAVANALEGDTGALSGYGALVRRYYEGYLRVRAAFYRVGAVAHQEFWERRLDLTRCPTPAQGNAGRNGDRQGSVAG